MHLCLSQQQRNYYFAIHTHSTSCARCMSFSHSIVITRHINSVNTCLAKSILPLPLPRYLLPWCSNKEGTLSFQHYSQKYFHNERCAHFHAAKLQFPNRKDLHTIVCALHIHHSGFTIFWQRSCEHYHASTQAKSAFTFSSIEAVHFTVLALRPKVTSQFSGRETANSIMPALGPKSAFTFSSIETVHSTDPMLRPKVTSQFCQHSGLKCLHVVQVEKLATPLY